MELSDTSVEATVSVALETLDEALGTDYSAQADTSAFTDEVIAYLDEHLTVTGTDGSVWTESYSSVVREAVEGIDSLSVEVTLDTAGSDPSGFTIAYDAIIEADPTHQAVVVLTDAAGDISTAGVLSASNTTLPIGDATPGVMDMIATGTRTFWRGPTTCCS